MTKHELFSKAHQIARSTLAIVGDYSIAFKLALKELYSSLKATKFQFNSATELSQFLIGYFKESGYNTRKVGIMAINKHTVKVRIKDKSIDFNFINDVVTKYTPNDFKSIVIYA